MEVSAEAKRIMVVALGKLYSSRTQRGGLRLHRSLLLTLVMKSARDIYHEAQAAERTTAADSTRRESPPESVMDDKAGGDHWESETPPHPAATLQTRTLPQESVGASAESCGSQPLGREEKENRRPADLHRHSRKRRAKAAAAPDFLPCKKAKIEQGKGLQQLALNSVLRNSVNCGGVLGTRPNPLPVSRAIVAF